MVFTMNEANLLMIPEDYGQKSTRLTQKRANRDVVMKQPRVEQDVHPMLKTQKLPHVEEEEEEKEEAKEQENVPWS